MASKLAALMVVAAAGGASIALLGAKRSVGRPTSTLPPGNGVAVGMARAAPFDGIDVAQYSEFWRRWRLVTVRYRKDNGEQRFVYANETAWQALQRGDSVYPDGAMFGKIALNLVADASFPNSAEPAGFTRVQLMRKDSRRYSRSNGWGYALFAAGSGIPREDVQSVVTACHACHAMVPERDFVFSRPAFERTRVQTVARAAMKERFRIVRVSALTSFQRQALARVVGGDSVDLVLEVRALSLHLFAGSVNESLPVLADLAAEKATVYAMWDEPTGQFIVARPLPEETRCRRRVKVTLTLSQARHTDSSLAGVLLPARPIVRTGQMCGGRWRTVPD